MYYQRLKDLREDKDLKQQDIGDILGISQQQYHLYESGKREMPFHLIIQLADFYNVSLDYIADRTTDQKSIYAPELFSENPQLSSEENSIINKYRMLDEKSKGKLIERLDMLGTDE